MCEIQTRDCMFVDFRGLLSQENKVGKGNRTITIVRPMKHFGTLRNILSQHLICVTLYMVLAAWMGNLFGLNKSEK